MEVGRRRGGELWTSTGEAGITVYSEESSNREISRRKSISFSSSSSSLFLFLSSISFPLALSFLFSSLFSPLFSLTLLLTLIPRHRLDPAPSPSHPSIRSQPSPASLLPRASCLMPYASYLLPLPCYAPPMPYASCFYLILYPLHASCSCTCFYLIS